MFVNEGITCPAQDETLAICLLQTKQAAFDANEWYRLGRMTKYARDKWNGS